MGLIEQGLGLQRKVQFIVGGTAVGGVTRNGTVVGQTIQGGNVVITLDASVKEMHKRESPPTKFEVEDGTTVSDHIILRPFELQIDGIISDAPISLVNELISVAGAAILPPVGIVAASAAYGLSSALLGSNKPSLVAYAQVLQLQSNRQNFNVLTTLNLYQNMFINSITVPRESASSNALVFTIGLSQLIIVQPQTVNIAKFLDPPNGAPKINGGNAQIDKIADETTKAIQKGLGVEQNTIGVPLRGVLP